MQEPTTIFEPGRTYSARSLCDWNCIWSFEVTARTPKTIKLREVGKTASHCVRISVRDGVESCNPLGCGYSMAPTLYAGARK